MDGMRYFVAVPHSLGCHTDHPDDSDAVRYTVRFRKKGLYFPAEYDRKEGNLV